MNFISLLFCTWYIFSHGIILSYFKSKVSIYLNIYLIQTCKHVWYNKLKYFLYEILRSCVCQLTVHIGNRRVIYSVIYLKPSILHWIIECIMTLHVGERNMNRIFAMCILFYMTKVFKSVCIPHRSSFIREQASLM